MKKIILFALAAALIALAACSPKDTELTYPEHDITIEQLEAAVDLYFDTSVMYKADDEYIGRTFDFPEGVCASALVKVPTGTNQDEYGVFIAERGKEKELFEALQAYREKRQEAWMDEYLPEEKHKVSDASVSSFDNYVYYVIAGTETREAVASAVRKFFT
ncbi:MAG: DUF4358 domain-containing protein [Oscillospiraceae bacterium]|nr:DUF4358 domain-containing protein [Oscillospiraceae bacterium]